MSRKLCLLRTTTHYSLLTTHISHYEMNKKKASKTAQTQTRKRVIPRAAAAPTCSLSMKPAYAQTAITDDANVEGRCNSFDEREMAKAKCVHPERTDKTKWCKDCPRRG